MQESFLHYIWQMQYFSKVDLQTTKGEIIEILDTGTLNANYGPDFDCARIKISGVEWVGNVEIHTASSSWNSHKHNLDKGYNNVILHIVWEDDKPISRNDGSQIPTLELKNRVDESLLKTYQQFVKSSLPIPCQPKILSVRKITTLSMQERALIQRLERKAEEVNQLVEKNGNDWEETTYQLLCRNFGFKVNAEPFFQLSRALPLKIIRKHVDKGYQIEALLFGLAGFLKSSKGDEYYLLLKNEYDMLERKYELKKMQMTESQWRFLRLRPPNFPTLRLAQWSALLCKTQYIFSSIIKSKNIKSLTELFSVSPSQYWLSHYQFSKLSNDRIHNLGKSSIENIVINTVVPIWVAYGKLLDEEDYIECSIKTLQSIPHEKNRIINKWSNTGIWIKSAFDSQSLIELYNEFCSKKRCLSCHIGSALIRPKS